MYLTTPNFTDILCHLAYCCFLTSGKMSWDSTVQEGNSLWGVCYLCLGQLSTGFTEQDIEINMIARTGIIPLIQTVFSRENEATSLLICLIKLRGNVWFPSFQRIPQVSCTILANPGKDGLGTLNTKKSWKPSLHLQWGIQNILRIGKQSILRKVCQIAELYPSSSGPNGHQEELYTLLVKLWNYVLLELPGQLLKKNCNYSMIALSISQTTDSRNNLSQATLNAQRAVGNKLLEVNIQVIQWPLLHTRVCHPGTLGMWACTIFAQTRVLRVFWDAITSMDKIEANLMGSNYLKSVLGSARALSDEDKNWGLAWSGLKSTVRQPAITTTKEGCSLPDKRISPLIGQPWGHTALHHPKDQSQELPPVLKPARLYGPRDHHILNSHAWWKWHQCLFLRPSEAVEAAPWRPSFWCCMALYA